MFPKNDKCLPSSSTIVAFFLLIPFIYCFVKIPPTSATSSISTMESRLSLFNLDHVKNDLFCTILSFGGAYAWLDIWVRLSNRGFDPKLSRKIIHSGSAPLFMLLWPLYSNDPSANYIASIVPLLQFLRLVSAGKLKMKEKIDDSSNNIPRGKALGEKTDGIVKAISRSGNREEALQGPLIYTIVLLFCTLLFFKNSPIGAIAIMQMAVGDGLADIVGRKYGQNKWPFSSSKSYIGTLAFILSAFIASCGVLYFYNYTGSINIDILQVWPKILLISLICGTVELFEMLGDDNWTVPVTGAVATWLIL